MIVLVVNGSEYFVVAAAMGDSTKSSKARHCKKALISAQFLYGSRAYARGAYPDQWGLIGPSSP